jgi:hypothetical protein
MLSHLLKQISKQFPNCCLSWWNGHLVLNQILLSGILLPKANKKIIGEKECKDKQKNPHIQTLIGKLKRA